MKPINRFFLLISSLIFLLPAVGSAEIVDRIVAIVNEDVITLAELGKEEQRVIGQLQQEASAAAIEREKGKIRTEVLNHLIERKLAEQEAKRLGLSVSEAEVDAAIEKIIRDHEITKEQLTARLEQDGISMEEYRQKLKEQIERFKLISQTVNAKIVITEDKLREHYKNNQRSYTGQQEYRVQHIVFSIPVGCSEKEKHAILKKAEDIRQRARDGADFECLARQFSGYPTASEGGNLGYLDKNELAPYMKDVITSLKTGEVSPVVETPIGYQIFKVIDIKESKEKTFEEAKEEIYQVLFEQDVNKRFMVWIKELRDRSYIEVLL
ncbi:MAG: peptidylprolyl isomerase [Deltaproteobacteria bacterium]|nr:peptidylprolyl isomerase [Deltaproteobacteria bacterium]